MQRLSTSRIMAYGLAVLWSSGCGDTVVPDPDAASGDAAPAADAPAADSAPVGDKEFPQFPQAYRGTGHFIDTSNPRNQLLAFYEFDMTVGRNRERVHYIDREELVINVYDLQGSEPDREYFISQDPVTGAVSCTVPPMALPKIFLRDWWLSNNMVYQGIEIINGYEADCWQGKIPQVDIPARFCNRADVYPAFAPLLKKFGAIEFYDFKGAPVEAGSFPADYFQVPPECDGL